MEIAIDIAALRRQVAMLTAYASAKRGEARRLEAGEADAEMVDSLISRACEYARARIGTATLRAAADGRAFVFAFSGGAGADAAGPLASIVACHAAGSWLSQYGPGFGEALLAAAEREAEGLMAATCKRTRQC